MEAMTDRTSKAYRQAYRNAEIIEVLTYRDDLAEVISKLNFLPGGVAVESLQRSRPSFGSTACGRTLARTGLPSLEEARKDFDRHQGQPLGKLRQGAGRNQEGEAGAFARRAPKRTAPIAPGEPLGISVEKADLMGRVEWAMMHGGRDITARKSHRMGRRPERPGWQPHDPLQVLRHDLGQRRV